MGQRIDKNTTDVTLDDTESATLTVKTGDSAEDVLVLIDGGASGTEAAAYDLVAEVDARGDGTWQEYDTVTNRTTLSWQDPAVGEQMQYELTNTSGSNGEDYRITVISQR